MISKSILEIFRIKNIKIESVEILTITKIINVTNNIITNVIEHK